MKNQIKIGIIAALALVLTIVAIYALPPSNPQLFGHTATEISLTLNSSAYTTIQQFIDSMPIRLAILTYEISRLTNMTTLTKVNQSIEIQKYSSNCGFGGQSTCYGCKFEHDEKKYATGSLKDFDIGDCNKWLKDYWNSQIELFKARFKQSNRCLNYPQWVLDSNNKVISNWNQNASIECNAVSQ